MTRRSSILQSASSQIGGLEQESYKKYLQATDFIEIQIQSNRIGNEENLKEFIKVFYGLIDIIDFAKATSMMLEKSYFEQFMALEKLCQTHRRTAERDKLVIAMFI